MCRISHVTDCRMLWQRISARIKRSVIWEYQQFGVSASFYEQKVKKKKVLRQVRHAQKEINDWEDPRDEWKKHLLLWSQVSLTTDVHHGLCVKIISFHPLTSPQLWTNKNTTVTMVNCRELWRRDHESFWNSEERTEEKFKTQSVAWTQAGKHHTI